MNLRPWVIARKELLQLRRDRLTMAMMLILPAAGAAPCLAGAGCRAAREGHGARDDGVQHDRGTRDPVVPDRGTDDAERSVPVVWSAKCDACRLDAPRLDGLGVLDPPAGGLSGGRLVDVLGSRDARRNGSSR